MNYIMINNKCKRCGLFCLCNIHWIVRIAMREGKKKIKQRHMKCDDEISDEHH